MGNKFLKTLPAIAIAAAMTLGILSVSACKPDLSDVEDLNATKEIANWSEGSANAFFESDGWTNGNPFNVQWTKSNVLYENGVMKLTIDDNPVGSVDTFNEYLGAEARSYQNFGYGDYEVCMKPVKKAGTASTFFLYTGPSEAENPEYDDEGNLINGNPWDEIDIEFLGKDTTKVQFNYYVNGKGGHEYMYDLGFDASEDFHTYGFRWAEDEIVWFVDGEPVHRVRANSLPSTESRILMNYWCGAPAAENWMGKYSDPGDEGPEYKWVKTSAAVGWGEIPEPVIVEEFEGDWADYEAISPEFESSNNLGGATAPYTFTPSADGKTVTIKYPANAAGEYDNANFDATEVAKDTNWMHFVLKNNSATETNDVRINIRNAANTANINSYAFGNGKELSTTQDGTRFFLEPNETIEVEIKFEGEVGNVEFMLDSMFSQQTGSTPGDITISDIKFAKQGEIIIPETPVENNNGVTINGSKVIFGGNVGGQPYAINTDDETNSMNVTYTAAEDASYRGVHSGDTDEEKAVIKGIAAGHNTFTAKITNNGTAAVNVRIDIMGTNTPSGTLNVRNLSATMNGSAVYTDLEWGGSLFDAIPAGATVEIAITFDTTYEIDKILFMIDSHKTGETTHSGDVTFSEMAFSGEGTVVDPKPDPDPAPSGDGALLTFIEQGGYKVDKKSVAANEVNITYEGITCNYANVYASVVTADTENKNTFTFTVVNNGDKAVQIRMDLQNTSNEVVSTDIKGTSVWKNNGEMYFKVEAGSTETITITYSEALKGMVIFIDSTIADAPEGTTYSGNITFKDFKFTNVA